MPKETKDNKSTDGPPPRPKDDPAPPTKKHDEFTEPTPSMPDRKD